MARVLLVDDDQDFSKATAEIIKLLGHDVDLAETVADARRLLKKNNYQRVFLDLMLPDGSGFHLLDDIPDNKNTKITIITGNSSIKSHVMSLYGMNVNYLVKPIDLEQLKQLFNVQDSSDESETKLHFSTLIGESDCMVQLYQMIKRVSQTNANVMLFGESGVGKEVVAHAIHFASNRQGDLVAANCGAFLSELIGSELFGHENGAFTGAVSRKPGVFEQAENGTLFLDEITEMPVSLQPNLLRVIENQSVTRLGGVKPTPVNCRVISATNRNEKDIAETKCLREDLYYRLAVFPLHVPSLRERLEDIPLLCKSFLQNLNMENATSFKINKNDLQRLCEYSWPGNVRELRHLVHRAYILTPENADFLVIPDSFESPFSRKRESSAITEESLVGNTIEDIEQKLILGTLEKYGNNKTKAAEALGVSVKTLYNRLHSYEEEKDVSE